MRYSRAWSYAAGEAALAGGCWGDERRGKLLYAPDRAAFEELRLLANERGGGTGKNPDVHICGLLADDGCYDTSYSADLNFGEVAGDGTTAAADGGVVFSVRGDDKMDEAGLGAGRDHGDAGAGGDGIEIEHVERGKAVGEVRGEIHVILPGIGLAVFGGDGGDGAGSSVDVNVNGFGKGWATLDVMVADELEVAALGEDGGLVVE